MWRRQVDVRCAAVAAVAAVKLQYALSHERPRHGKRFGWEAVKRKTTILPHVWNGLRTRMFSRKH